MDIEDLFNEMLHEQADEEEESKQQPMVIPEFGPCSGGGDDDHNDDERVRHPEQNDALARPHRSKLGASRRADRTEIQAMGKQPWTQPLADYASLISAFRAD